jgi:hypothetical protein
MITIAADKTDVIKVTVTMKEKATITTTFDIPAVD